MMTRLLIVTLAMLAVTHMASAQNATPNVVMIISDDQGWTDYGFMGHPQIKTPHLDRLAKESALFRRGYVTAPLCCPSLATLITGLHPHQHKIVGNDPKGNKQDRQAYAKLREKLIANIDNVPTLPRLLANKGYLSHQSGKWWQGNYRRGGFTHGMTRGFPQKGGRHGDDGLTIGRKGMKPIYDFIQVAQKEKKPFFLWYAPFLPHTPHNPPQRLLKKYLAGGKLSKRDAAYYAMCEWFDETCGQLLDYLDKNGLRDNTLIVYVTDNGWKQGPGNQMRGGKRSPYEGGIRTPIMLRWPGKIKPGDYDTPVSAVDLVPTILASCGIKPTKEMQGLNLLDSLAGKGPKRDTIFGAAYEHDVQDLDDPAKSLLFRYAIESGRWKLVTKGFADEGDLFDLKNDPHEEKSVAGENPEIVKRLAGRLRDWWDGK